MPFKQPVPKEKGIVSKLAPELTATLIPPKQASPLKLKQDCVSCT